MKGRRGFLAGAATLTATSAWPCPPPEDGSPFLFFVGNSFTGQHAVPRRVAGIASRSTKRVHSDSVVPNGARLHETVSHMPDLLRTCSAFHATAVILQDFSTEPLTAEGRERSAAAMARLRDRGHLGGLLQADAQFVLFATWARRAGHRLYRRAGMPRTPEEMTEIVHAHYSEQAQRLDATVAPVGRAWQRAIAAGYELHARDWYHANETGAHLTALVLAHALGFALPDEPLAEIAATTPT